MDTLDILYSHYNHLLIDLHDAQANELTTNLLQERITRDYFDKVNTAIELLLKFYNRHLSNKRIQDAVSARFNDQRTNNVKFCLLIDIMRCYDGLDHPTSFNTPEGIALLVLLDKMIGATKIERYEHLTSVSSKTLELIDIIPYINECSFALGDRYSLLLSSIFEQTVPEIDHLYRRLLYNLCKQIAEVDGVITMSEKDWLNEIALLNDDDPDNDIDIRGL